MPKRDMIISEEMPTEQTEAIEAVTKRTRKDRSLALTPHTEPGDNTKYLNHSLRWFSVPRVDIQNEEAVWQRSVEYLQACAEDDMKPSITGYALALGYSRSELHRIARGEVYAGKNLASCDTIKKVKALIENQYEAYMQNGKINPVAGIFMLKNNFADYTDKQEIEVKATPLGDSVSREEIAEKYIEGLPDED